MHDGTRLSFGIKTTQWNTTYDEILKVWREADTRPEIEHAWLWDHFVPLRGDVTAPLLESWTLLAALAAQTERLRLGVMVTGNPVRPPAVLAKMAATVDIIARGRLDFGIGAGGTRLSGANPAVREYAAYGIPLVSPAEGVARLGESCTIIRRLWAEDRPFDYSGHYYQLEGAVCEPKPLQKPRPPILIGGAGERMTLRVVAEHADLWNIPGPPYVTIEEIRHKSRVLDDHCAAIGRDPRAITRSTQLNLRVEEPEAARETLFGLIDAGVRHFVLGVLGQPPSHPSVVGWAIDEIIAPVSAKV